MSKYSNSQEYRIAKAFENRGFNSRRTPNSGNHSSPQFKGDVTGEKGDLRVLIDHKSTVGRKITQIKREDLEKLSRLGIDVNRVPILTLSYKGCHTLYAVLELNDLLDVIS